MLDTIENRVFCVEGETSEAVEAPGNNQSSWLGGGQSSKPRLSTFRWKVLNNA